MDPDGRVHERMLFCELNSGIEMGRTIPIANCDHRSHSCFASASNNLLAVRVKLAAIEMCVGIYKHRASGLRRQRSESRKFGHSLVILVQSGFSWQTLRHFLAHFAVPA